MWKIWPQLLSASEPFVLVNGWDGNCFFKTRIWWHCPSTWALVELLSTTTTSQISGGDEDLRLSAVGGPHRDPTAPDLFNQTPLLKVPKLPIAGWHQRPPIWCCHYLQYKVMCVCWVRFWTNTFPTLLWRKNMSCANSSKNATTKPPYVGHLEGTQYHSVDDFRKSLSNPQVFSAPAQAPKGTLTNTRDGEVFVLRPKHWSSNMMYGAW